MSFRMVFWVLSTAGAMAAMGSMGCSPKVETQKLSYEESHNGCTTGYHEFANADTMCAALQDENINNGCAAGERESFFKQNCSGQFKPALKSYTFNEHGVCGTGRHGFDTNADMCKSLQNEKLNQSCALAERESYFKLQCKGDFKGGKSSDHSGVSTGASGGASDDNDGNSASAAVLSNLDCKGYYISENGINSDVKTISWSARDLSENIFPDMPDHSSIVLSCTPVSTK